MKQKFNHTDHKNAILSLLVMGSIEEKVRWETRDKTFNEYDKYGYEREHDSYIYLIDEISDKVDIMLFYERFEFYINTIRPLEDDLPFIFSEEIHKFLNETETK